MSDLIGHLAAHPYPAALDLVRRSFAEQADRQTCGAAAIHHGLLLGGLTVPAATLEAALSIRARGGTHYTTLLACLRRLGLAPRQVKKPVYQSTAAFLDGLRPELDEGAFLLPCIHGGNHWVCVGAWDGRRVWVIDSFFPEHGRFRRLRLRPRLSVRGYAPSEFDDLGWEGCVNLVGPGVWACSFAAWQPARSALLGARGGGRRGPLAVQVAAAAHQHLNDHRSPYTSMAMHLAGGVVVSVAVKDPGADAVGVAIPEAGGWTVSRVAGGSAADGGPAEVVIRGEAVRAVHLRSK